jgi:diaminopimelate decarboxylase
MLFKEAAQVPTSECVVADADDWNLPYETSYEQDAVYHKAQDIISTGNTKPFYLMNLKRVDEAVELWHEHLPDVQIYYAVKTNTDEHIIRRLI